MFRIQFIALGNSETVNQQEHAAYYEIFNRMRDTVGKFQGVTRENEKKKKCGEGGSVGQERAKSVMKNAEAKKVWHAVTQ